MPSPDINNPQYKSDLEFGLTAEIDVKGILENKFGKLKKLGKYHPFDFENNEYLIELKSRRINHNHYPTAMINLSKLEKTNNIKKNRIIAFNYMDGIYYWKVDDNYTTGIGGRNDRGIDEFSDMAFIKYTDLIKI